MTRSEEILSLMGGKNWLELVISAKRVTCISRNAESLFNEDKRIFMSMVKFGFRGIEGVRRIAEIKEYCFIPGKEHLYSEIDIYSRFWGRKLHHTATLLPFERKNLNQMFHKITNLYIHPFD